MNTGVGCHALLQVIFPTQGSNSRLMSPALAGRFFTISTTWEALGLSFPPPIPLPRAAPQSWLEDHVCTLQPVALLGPAVSSTGSKMDCICCDHLRRQAKGRGRLFFAGSYRRGSVCVVTEGKKKAKNLRHSLCLLIPEKKRKKKHSPP